MVSRAVSENKKNEIPPLASLFGQTLTVALTNAIPLYGVIKMGWNAFALVLLFILEGVTVLFSDTIKHLFDKGTRKTQNIVAFEYAFILFYGVFAILVFGPYDSLEAAVADRFRLVGALFSSEIRTPLFSLIFMRLMRLIHDLADSGAFGGKRRRKLQLDGGGWIFLLFFAVMLAPLVAKTSPNPMGGLIALVVLKTLGEIFAVWAVKIK